MYHKSVLQDISNKSEVHARVDAVHSRLAFMEGGWDGVTIDLSDHPAAWVEAQSRQYVPPAFP